MRLPQLGDTFHSKYRIEEVLGTGGFATVFRAVDVGAQRPVAIKILTPGEEGYAVTTASRFFREVRVVANLRDPHSVTMYEYGRTDDGLLFMVFELVPGRDLSEVLKDGPLDADAAMHVLRQVLHALREAHGLGLLHRDLKPENIRVYDYMGDPMRVKLLDFGIAKPLVSDGGEITHSGLLVGTPHYMAPEQLFGDAEVTAAADIYCLGIVAYEMVTGRPSDHLRLISAHQELKLGSADRVREPLRSVVNRMVRREPGDRLQSADDVLSALEVQQAPVRGSRGASASTLVIGGLGIGLGVALVATLAVKALREEPLPPPIPRPIAAPSIALASREPAARPDAGKMSDGCGIARQAGQGDISVLVGLTTTRATTWLPRDYDAHRHYPLMLLFHDEDQLPEAILAETGMAQLADEKNFVVVAPYDGIEGPWIPPRDLSGARRVIERAFEMYCLDRSRVYAIGHGKGGGNAIERIPCELPIVSAIASTGYRSRGYEVCRPETPIPYIFLGPLKDGYAPPDGSPSCTGKLHPSIDENIAMWTDRNHCSDDSKTWFAHEGSICTAWQDCAAPFVSCKIDGGRNWPGTGQRASDFRGCDGDPADFPYGEAIWRFFNR